MDLLRPPPPLIISNNNRKAFSDWKQKYNLYFTASGADTKLNNDQKKALLLHCIGDEALAIYNTFDNKEKLTYEELMVKLEQHCCPTVNETYSRYIFFTRNMKDDETYDEYITVLKRLSRVQF